MRSFWSIIPRYILKSKKRVVFIALGIMISMCVVVSLTFIKDGLKTAMYNKMVNDMGGVYDFVGYSRGFLDYNSLKNEGEIKDITLVKPLGVSEISGTKYSINISSYENNVERLLNFKLVEGHYPKGGNEIAIEKWLLDVLPNKYKIGDTIKLKYRTTYRKRNTEFNGESKETEFVITGIFEHPYRMNSFFGVGKVYANPEFVKSLLRESELEQVEDMVYITLKDGYSPIDTRVKWVSTNKYTTVSFGINPAKYEFNKTSSKYDLMLSFIFIILGGISSIIIFNIFNVSVAERIKEFGMLRAIGCPPWKIKVMVIGEGILMGAVFIPLGIVIGSYITKFVIRLATGVNVYGGVTNISLTTILVASTIGIVTIIVGTYFPANKAAKVSPIEAISSNNVLDLKGTSIKIGLQQSGSQEKWFSFETNLAFVNLIRNKKRTITTIITIVITLTLFITVNYIIGSTNPVAVFKDNFGGDFKITSKSWITKAKVEELKNVKGVKNVIATKVFDQGVVELKEENMTSDGIKFLKSKAANSNFLNECLKAKRFLNDSIYIGYKPQELERLKKYVVEGEIDVEKMQKEPLLVYAQNLNGYNHTNVKAGDAISLWCTKYDEAGNKVGEGIESFTVCAIVDENAFKYVEPSIKSMVILSEPTMEEYNWIYGFQRINVELESNANYDQCKNEIIKLFENVKGSEVFSFKDELKKVENDNHQIVYAMYTIVIIVALVSIINLINIMNMSALMRKREFGFMRAMGLSKTQVKKIIRREGLIYSLVSGGISALLGSFISVILAIKSKVLFGQEVSWKLPISNISITVLVTVIIVMIFSILPSRILYKSSVVESIREID